MGDVVSFSAAKKAKAKAAREAKAGANRMKFGRSKSEKARDSHEKSWLARMLDGAQRHSSTSDEARPDQPPSE